MLVTSTCSEMYMANSLGLEEIFIYHLQPNAILYVNSSQLSNKPKNPSRAYVFNLRFLAGKIMVVGYNGTSLQNVALSPSLGIASSPPAYQVAVEMRLCHYSNLSNPQDVPNCVCFHARNDRELVSVPCFRDAILPHGSPNGGRGPSESSHGRKPFGGGIL